MNDETRTQLSSTKLIAGPNAWGTAINDHALWGVSFALINKDDRLSR